MAEGFLGRWSRRKRDVEAGRPVPAEPPLEPRPAHSGASAPALAPQAPPASPSEPALATQPAPAPPTLEDVEALTPQSDFSRFASAEVAPEVKNAAMKKLFADPHFNVMDGLDVYIEDYGVPDPLPAQMLRSMVSAEFLGLLREPEQGEVASAEANNSSLSPSAGQSVAQCAPVEPTLAPTQAPEPDAHPDLRLQQDLAAGRPGPGHGAG